MTLLADRAETALHDFGAPLGQSSAEAAQAMVDIAAAHVSQGIRLVSVQRGHDPKDYALYGYGGMGPMIGALAAAELKIRRVVIPPHPGLFSALGLLVADLKRIYRETHFLPAADETVGEVAAIFAALRSRAETEFAAFDRTPEDVVFEHALEMRYQGQGFELLAPIDLQQLASGGADYLHRVFRAAHQARYGAVSYADPIEIVTFRLVAEVRTSGEVLSALTSGRALPQAAPALEDGEILFRGKAIACRFAWRESLPADFVLAGPAIIEEPTATTLVPPGWSALVDTTGALILSPEAQP